jgi:hypothetical protein
MTNTNTLNMLALMSVISQLENRSKMVKDTIPLSLKSTNIINGDKRVKISKVVPKVIGSPRKFGNLSGNARTNMRI